MLNINRPAVFRQYHGTDIIRYDDTTVKIFTYGYGSKRNSVGSDPNKFFTKPFGDNMHQIASFLHLYLQNNTGKLDLHLVDIIKKIKSYTLLVY